MARGDAPRTARGTTPPPTAAPLPRGELDVRARRGDNPRRYAAPPSTEGGLWGKRSKAPFR
ncbi:MAG: hypothetical protein LBM98_09455 [Oscillospiraceae bacterium]|nr:hypothetical protein [Oscillospiraceae bacterium]